jgi:D-alanine-D-alanine ligase-like ATP-grasp enzyme
MIRRTWIITTASSGESVTPLSSLQEQITYTRSHGIKTDVLIDPNDRELAELSEDGSRPLVFPLCLRSMRLHAEYVCAAVERLGLPLVASSKAMQALVLDKNRVADWLKRPTLGFSVPPSDAPEFLMVVDDALSGMPLSANVIVKPARLGGSFGIDATSVVAAHSAAIHAAASRIEQRFGQEDTGVRVERYTGNSKEYTVGIIGNGPEIRTSVAMLRRRHGENHQVFSEWQKKMPYQERDIQFAAVTNVNLRNLLAYVAIDEFNRLKMCDVARIDIIADDQGFHIIDINGLPVLGRSLCAEWLMADPEARNKLLHWVLCAAYSRHRSILL